MKVLDLFCGQGGAARGYADAGFEVVGVDIEPQPRYPYPFMLADALSVPLGGFDLIHASPPCQKWSVASPNREIHPDLLRPIRNRLQEQDTPYVIENVVGAPLLNPITLCGTFFPELRVLRHRLFEASFYIEQPHLDCASHPPIYTRHKTPHLNEWKDYLSVYGGNHATLAACKDAMGGIDWMNRKGLSESIPPAYTKYIGEQFKINLQKTMPM